MWLSSPSVCNSPIKKSSSRRRRRSRSGSWKAVDTSAKCHEAVRDLGQHYPTVIVLLITEYSGWIIWGIFPFLSFYRLSYMGHGNMSLVYFFFRLVRSERHTVPSWGHKLLSVIGFSFCSPSLDSFRTTLSIWKLRVVLDAINGASLLKHNCKMSRLKSIIMQKLGKSAVEGNVTWQRGWSFAEDV